MKFFKNHESMIKKAALGSGIILLIAVVTFSIFFLMNKEAVTHFFSKEPAKEILTGVLEEQSDTAGTTEMPGIAELTEETGDGTDLVILESTEEVTDDLRIHGFPYIQMTSRLKPGDYVDVRISFANGGDFVLLSKKKIQGLGPLREEGTNAIWLTVSEEEILRLSSAVVDAYLNQGSSIYAIQYVSENQKEAVVNYVVSDLIKQLMEEDPNIVKMAENVVEGTVWKNYDQNVVSQNQANSEEVYPEQEEIIYMD